jgi:rhomboid-related protein 1/2/3
MPPPLFIPCITCIQVISFYLTFRSTGTQTSDQILEDNVFVFRSDAKSEVWRFLFYMFVHAEWVHLLFNLTIQLLIGLPLEMVHGSGRLAVIYLSGVLAGSLGASVFDRNAVLVGASGGVYALLAGHLANVLLNYQEMQLGILRVVAIISVGMFAVTFFMLP